MKYTEQIFEGLNTYNKNHSLPANQIGMTPAMRELVKSELGADGIIVSFHGVHVNCRDISDKPLFWIGGNVDFYTPKKPIDRNKIENGLKVHAGGSQPIVCEHCPYEKEGAVCSVVLCKEALEYIEELKGEIN